MGRGRQEPHRPCQRLLEQHRFRDDGRRPAHVDPRGRHHPLRHPERPDRQLRPWRASRPAGRRNEPQPPQVVRRQSSDGRHLELLFGDAPDASADSSGQRHCLRRPPGLPVLAGPRGHGVLLRDAPRLGVGTGGLLRPPPRPRPLHERLRLLDLRPLQVALPVLRRRHDAQRHRLPLDEQVLLDRHGLQPGRTDWQEVRLGRLLRRDERPAEQHRLRQRRQGSPLRQHPLSGHGGLYGRREA